MGDKLDTCLRCNGPQIEIDRFGERLVGCIECNRWTWPTVRESISMALPGEDLEALKGLAGCSTRRGGWISAPKGQ